MKVYTTIHWLTYVLSIFLLESKSFSLSIKLELFIEKENKTDVKGTYNKKKKVCWKQDTQDIQFKLEKYFFLPILGD